MDAFANTLSLTDKHPVFVTPSAFSQARHKVSENAFVDLNQQLNQLLIENKGLLKTWQGHRVCAIDGTSIRMPNSPEVVEYFGVQNGRGGQAQCPIGMASVFYDVLNKMVIDSTIRPVRYSERLCAKAHLEQAQKNDLILYDRGYTAFWMFSLHQHKQQPFCMRARVNRSLEAKKFIESGQKEKIISLEPNAPSIKTCKEMGLSIQPVKLRFVRVDLPNEVEVLMTNLMDSELYPAHLFKSLYHLRWGIEENYKRLKQWLEIENFSGQSVLSVKQDFYAKILAHNLTTLLSWQAQENISERTQGRKYQYQVNMAFALSKSKNELIKLLWIAKDSPRKTQRLMNQIILRMSGASEAIRENRSFARKMKNIKNDIHYSAYKSAL